MSDESAADDDDMAENVRMRCCPLSLFNGCVGKVATDLAEDTDVRRLKGGCAWVDADEEDFWVSGDPPINGP